MIRFYAHRLSAMLAIGVIAGLLVSLVWAPDATAQFGGRGPRLSEEKREAAWALHAKTVAKKLGLNKEQTEKLVASYKSARQSYGSAIREVMGAGAGGDRRERFRKLRETQGGKLQAAFKEFLSEEQLEKATASLGSFDSSGDRMIDLLASFGLGEEKLDKGLDQVSSYIVKVDEVRRKAIASGDFMSMRGPRQELKEKLDTAIAALLSEEQLTKWKEATQRRRGGPGGGGP